MSGAWAGLTAPSAPSLQGPATGQAEHLAKATRSQGPSCWQESDTHTARQRGSQVVASHPPATPRTAGAPDVQPWLKGQEKSLHRAPRGSAWPPGVPSRGQPQRSSGYFPPAAPGMATPHPSLRHSPRATRGPGRRAGKGTGHSRRCPAGPWGWSTRCCGTCGQRWSGRTSRPMVHHHHHPARAQLPGGGPPPPPFPSAPHADVGPEGRGDVRVLENTQCPSVGFR